MCKFFLPQWRYTSDASMAGGGVSTLLAQPKDAMAPAAHGATPATKAPNVLRDWGALVRANKCELGESYMVFIFLGDVPDDPEQWITSPSFVGFHAAYTYTDHSSDRKTNVISSLVGLNDNIAKQSGLSSFEPSVVAPYLEKNLHWRARLADGPPVELERLPSLEVVVKSEILTREPGSIFPIVGAPEYHYHITHGRQGGSRHA